ncbi:GTP-binding protein [Salinifilum aidingensis]
MGPSEDQRTPLLVVAGMHPEQVASTAEAVRADTGAVLVHHDLGALSDGLVRRTVRRGDLGETTALELVHGCVSCTLREDLLPLLRRLADEPDVTSIVLRLDPALDPEALCWALTRVELDGRGLEHDIAIGAVLCVVDLPSWLDDATGTEELAERGLGAAAEDERTVAQLAVGQAEFADALVLAGRAVEPWQQARTEAVLRRVAPSATWGVLERLDVPELLGRLPAAARRGEVDGAFGPLLRGQPPFEPDAGVSLLLFEQRRPFHPERLHAAVDALLEGVVRARGRVWLATQPDDALWIESAGGSLGVAHAGPWVAALDAGQRAELDSERYLKASLSWDERYGDRVQELVVITHDTDPEDVDRALHRALLTDAELAAGREGWAAYSDPFGTWHADPCGEDPAIRAAEAAESDGEG